ncbi:MAG: glycosyltransferase family 4 protein [Bryobacteraceae bacterium]|nr:glycosyltransferase family 4 protein [Bryobacteraceae bacterium]
MHVVMTRREALDVPDGINIFLFSLADALADAGHRVTLVSTTPADRSKLVDYFSPKTLPSTVALSNLREISYRNALISWVRRGHGVLRSLSPDMVIINGAVPLSLPGLTCTVSHDIEKRFKHPVLRRAYKRYCYSRSDLIVATCTEVRSALSEELDISPGRIEVIPTCVRLSTYRPQPIQRRERAVLHMGTVAYKNPSATIRAFRHIASQGCRLYLTGKMNDVLERELSTLTEAERRHVELTGYVSAERLIDLLGAVRVVSVPSVYHVAVASPTVIEALASGTPVVSTSSISRSVLQDGENGLVRDPNDSIGMANAYSLLLDDDITWKRMSQAAASTAQRFNAETVAAMYLRLAAGKQSEGLSGMKVHRRITI